MADSCCVTAHCYNSKGEIVESKLWKDLLSYLPDRTAAKKYYALATSDQFLEIAGTEGAKFDENGQITLSSLKKIASIDIKQEDAISKANKRIKSGNYSFIDAITKAQTFNRTDALNEEYLATVEQNDNGSYYLHVVPKTEDSITHLREQVANQSIQDRLMSRLTELGCSVEFLEKGSTTYNGRYSTINAQRTADGAYALIQAVKGEKGEVITEYLAEEAGHFAIGALSSSPLVKRLEKLMTDDVLKKVLEEDHNKYKGIDAKREAMGTLVGKALMKDADNRSSIGRLVSKIVSLAKRVFYWANKDMVSMIKTEAEELANQIADDFMHDPNINIEDALDTEETLYNKELTVNEKKHIEIGKILDKLIKDLKVINTPTAKYAERLVEDFKEGVDFEVGDVEYSVEALQAIGYLLGDLQDFIMNIPDKLDSIDLSSEAAFKANIADYAKILKEVETVLCAVKAASSIIYKASIADPNNANSDTFITTTNDKNESGYTTIVDNSGQLNQINLRSTAEELHDTISKYLINYTVKRKEFVVKFLENSLGSKYIQQSRRILFKKGKKGVIEAKLKRANGENLEVSVSQIVDELADSDGWIRRIFDSASNSNDLVVQIADRVSKTAHRAAERKALQIREDLIVLESKMPKDFKTSMLYETIEEDTGKTDTNGNPITKTQYTGNLVGLVKYGQWERDYNEFKKQCIEEFKSLYPNWKTEMTMIQRAIKWEEFYKGKISRWHRGDETHPAHSVWDDEAKMYIPNSDPKLGIDYTSKQYADLFIPNDSDSPAQIASKRARLTWYNQYMEIKQSINNLIPDAAGPVWRAPQFKAIFTNKIRNRRIYEGGNTITSGIKAIKYAINRTISETFCEDSDDTEFGGEHTYTLEDDELFKACDDDVDSVNQLKRIPVFGINKLKKMSDLSTDLLSATYAFAGMATNNEAIRTVSDALAVTGSQLRERKVGDARHSNTSEKETALDNRAYMRYMKYLDKSIFGITQPKLVFRKEIVINKVVNFFNRATTFKFLAGNIGGATANLNTGIIQIVKEAVAGEFFDWKDWRVAHSTYFSNIPQAMWNAESIHKNDFMSLWSAHFDVRARNELEQRQWHRHQAKLSRFLQNCVWYPYSTGDHYMQMIPFLAIANKIKLYDSDGKETPLLNCYEPTGIKDPDNPAEEIEIPDAFNIYKTTQKTLVLKKVYYKDKNSIAEAQSIQSLIDKYEKAIKNTQSHFSLLEGTELTEDDADFMQNNEHIAFNETDPIATLKSLRSRLNDLVWNHIDEFQYAEKCREVANRLHGVYDDANKGEYRQNIWGNLLMSMKGYLVGFIRRYWDADHYSVILGQNVEGSMNTLIKLFGTSMRSRKHFSNALFTFMFPRLMRNKKWMKEQGFSEHQYANIKRAQIDYFIIILIRILKGLASGILAEEDDEDHKRMLGLAYYFLSRAQQEQDAMIWIGGMVNEANNAATLLPPAVNGIHAWGKLITQGIGGIIDRNDREDSPYYYQKKEGTAEKGDSKFWNNFMKSVPYGRFWARELAYPVDAAKNYEFQRNLR